jgi:hypothetical protein
MMKELSERKIRGFRVMVHPGAKGFGIALEVTNGHQQKTAIVAKADDEHTLAILPSVMTAVKSSGHARTILGPQRKAPIVLSEEAGVRLALALVTTAPVTKQRRISLMLSGIDDMATEEAYYWYAKCMGPDSGRVRKALRLFLADEQRDE